MRCTQRSNVGRRLRPIVAALCGPATAHAAPFAYLSNFSANTVSVFDTATETLVDTIPLLTNPMGVPSLSAALRQAY